MANAKNTIQNIPLTGNLNLNKLKTDVASFEGYNEKNTTVFGGELTNIYTKETELGNKDTTYTIFNSKGEPFTIKNKALYDKDNNNLGNLNVPYYKEITGLPSNTYWFSELVTNSSSRRIQVALAEDGALYMRRSNYRVELDEAEFVQIYKFNLQNVSILSINANLQHYDYNSNTIWLTIGIVSNTTLYYYSLYDFNWEDRGTLDLTKIYTGEEYLQFATDTAFVNVITTDNDDIMCVEAVPFSGKNSSPYSSYVKFVKLKKNVGVTKDNILFYHDNIFPARNIDIPGESGFSDASPFIHFVWGGPNGNIPSGYVYKTTEVTPTRSYTVFAGRATVDEDLTGNTLLYIYGTWYYTGHDGNYYIPGLKSPTSDIYYGYIVPTYADGTLLSVSAKGRLIESPGTIQAPFYNINFLDNISYKGHNGKWYVYYNWDSSYTYDKDAFIQKNINKIILDNRYVSIKLSNGSRFGFYDIEEKKQIDAPVSYMSTLIPVKKFDADVDKPQETTGIIYASGYNTNYNISKIPFINYTMNANVMVGFPVKGYIYLLPTVNFSAGTWNIFAYEQFNIDIFYSMGDQVSSAAYKGTNVSYRNTVYPIITTNNILYPITWNTNIIRGYSNNDMITDYDTTYPLIYWSSNQKVYAYYALSAMSNVKGAFALQGQQYTFDDTNIYNVQFANGIIQSSNSVCYIENMKFLGTLPTSAIFYSKYNKTFYKFTGDNILSKMFEANDIDEIRMVGQNPSTLSLWISTDKGIYVLSDTDMFKLDYLPENIYFDNEKTILVSEGETNWIEDDISLYDIENGGNPNKIKFKTKYYGLGGEHKALYDCWYIRLHSDEKVSGTITVKMNTITDSSFASNEETRSIEKSMYDENNQIYLKFQPKYQSGVAVQLELESDIPIYQISLGANVTDQITQQAKFNF